jgi:hypothetical protein
MAKIAGISLELKISPSSWAGTKDALFLGFHGLSGGREFRLNELTQVSISNSTVKLKLGLGCCSTNEAQVNYSAPGALPPADNDPALIPQELVSIQYVYLRKETDDISSGTDNDDMLTLERAKVLLCDGSGALRQFRLKGEINFSDQVGLQHWLPEVAPPRCKVDVRLVEIRHRDIRTKPAGGEWFFSFGAGPAANGNPPFNIVQDYSITVPTNADEWTRSIGVGTSFEVVGCCGQTVEIRTSAGALENDLIADDWGGEFGLIVTKCSPQPSPSLHEVVANVYDANIPRGASEITFVYSVTAICLS